jgi:TPR repeat protein
LSIHTPIFGTVRASAFQNITIFMMLSLRKVALFQVAVFRRCGAAFTSVKRPQMLDKVLIRNDSRLYHSIQANLYQVGNSVRSELTSANQFSSTQFDTGVKLMEDGKYMNAIPLLEQASENGHVEAKFYLGLLLTSDQKPIVENNPKEGIKEVRSKISNMQKAALSAKKSKSSGALGDFQVALAKRKAKTDSTASGPMTEDSVTKKELSNNCSDILGTSYDKGFALLESAAQLGHGGAACLLGNLLLSKAQSLLTPIPVSSKPSLAVTNYESKDSRLKEAKKLICDAINYYTTAISLKNGPAAYNLGVLYYDGVSFVEEPKPFVVEQSNASKEASAVVPSIDIVTSDMVKSLAYFEQAAAFYEPSAVLWCGYCYSMCEGGVSESDAQKALQYYLHATSFVETSGRAHFYLSLLFKSGLKPLESDVGLYIQHFRKAVEDADTDACVALAHLHLQAYATSMDSRGSELFSEMQGNVLLAEETQMLCDDLSHWKEKMDSKIGPVKPSPFCCTNASHSCSSKTNAPIEMQTPLQPSSHFERAVALLSWCSAEGNASASLTLGSLSYNGMLSTSLLGDDGSNEDVKRKAFELYSLAADQGSADAWRNIASMYFLGDGVPRNENLAREIMRVAVKTDK